MGDDTEEKEIVFDSEYWRKRAEDYERRYLEVLKDNENLKIYIRNKYEEEHP